MRYERTVELTRGHAYGLLGLAAVHAIQGHTEEALRRLDRWWRAGTKPVTS